MPTGAPRSVIHGEVNGTIVAAAGGILRRLSTTLAHFGMQPPTRGELSHWIGPPMYESFQVNVGMTPEQATEAVTFYRGLNKAEGYTSRDRKSTRLNSSH